MSLQGKSVTSLELQTLEKDQTVLITTTTERLRVRIAPHPLVSGDGAEATLEGALVATVEQNTLIPSAPGSIFEALHGPDSYPDTVACRLRCGERWSYNGRTTGPVQAIEVHQYSIAPSRDMPAALSAYSGSNVSRSLDDTFRAFFGPKPPLV